MWHLIFERVCAFHSVTALCMSIKEPSNLFGYCFMYGYHRNITPQHSHCSLHDNPWIAKPNPGMVIVLCMTNQRPFHQFIKVKAASCMDEHESSHLASIVVITRGTTTILYG